MIEKNVFKVVRGKYGKVWKCTYSTEPDLIGEITVCGFPYPARRLPLGTIWTTILTIPDKRK